MRVLFGPWTPDSPDLDSAGLEECVNVIPLSSGYGAVRDASSLSHTSTVSAMVTGAFFAPYVPSLTVDGVQFGNLYVGTGSAGPFRLFQFNANASGVGGTPVITRADKSRTASYGAASLWRFTRFGDSVLATNGIDEMQIQTGISGGGTAPNFRDQSASASAPICRELVTVRDFVFAGGIVSGGAGAGENRVQWCQINNPQRWTPTPRLQSDFQDLPDAAAIVAMTGGDFAAVFTGNSIWRSTYVGSPVIFRFDEVAPRISIASVRSVARFQNLTFFLAQSGFHVFDGQTAIPIGDGSVDRSVLDDIMFHVAGINGGATIGEIDPINNLYVVSVLDSGAAGFNKRTRLLIYNWRTRQWAQVNRNHGYLTPSQLIGIRSRLHAQEIADPVNDRLGVGIFNDNAAPSYMEFRSDTRLTATFASGEAQLFSNSRAFVSGVRPLIQGDANTAITVEVAQRNTLTETVSYDAAVSLNANGLAPLRSDGRYHRVRVKVSGGFERAIGFDIDAEKSGER